MAVRCASPMAFHTDGPRQPRNPRNPRSPLFARADWTVGFGARATSSPQPVGSRAD
jgi:hypothetical protein